MMHDDDDDAIHLLISIPFQESGELSDATGRH